MALVRRESSRRNDAVNMRMEQQVLTQVCRTLRMPISAPRRLGLAAISSAEAALAVKQVIERARVFQRKDIQFVWNAEGDVKIAGR